MSFIKELRAKTKKIRKARKVKRRKYADLSMVDKHTVEEMVEWVKENCQKEASAGEGYFYWSNTSNRYRVSTGSEADNNRLRAEEILRMQYGLNVYRMYADDGNLSSTYVKWYGGCPVDFCIKWYKKIENTLYRMVRK